MQAAIVAKAGQAPPMLLAWPMSQAHPTSGGVKKLATLVTAVKRPMCFGEPLVSWPICVCEPIQPIVCRNPVISCKITTSTNWVTSTDVTSGTRGYSKASTTLAMAQKIITRRTPRRSNNAPLCIEKITARNERAPTAIPIKVADMPRLSRHHSGTRSWIIGKMAMLAKAVE